MAKPYTVPIAWMVLMFVFSTDMGSSEHTTAFLDPIVQYLLPSLSQGGVENLLLSFRKMAHLLEYAILAILWFSALHQTENRASRQAVMFALLISMTYAGLDEFHQSFIASRTGSIVDVGIDALGSVVGILCLKGWGFLSMAIFSKKKVKYFGWWFAWGGFSTVMLLIVLKGGPFVFWQMLLLILVVATMVGIGGVAYYVRRT